ncbi:MAG TPA: membrane protein insertase YidC [Deltaproteobacteria bacterium]|nr:membrane protein insertase YidC [Deltaproteobacteria bacterium]HOI05792.1 membrane protein insertase YidC [Deltaproteobacteria bacterium]
MEKRTLLAVIISLVILVGWDLFIMKPNAPKQPPKQAARQEAPVPQKVQAPAVTAPSQAQPLPVPAAQAQTVVVDTPLYQARFSSAGGALTSFHLKKYREGLDPKSKTVNVINTPTPVFGYGENFTDASVVYSVTKSQPDSSGITREIAFTAQIGQGIVLRKTFTVDPKTYTLNYRMAVENHTAAPFSMDMRQYMDGIYRSDFEASGYSFEGPVLLNDKHLEEFKLKKVENVGIFRDFTGSVQWFGFEDKYFLRTLIPTTPAGTTLTIKRTSDTLVRMMYRSGTTTIQPGVSVQKDYLLFVGPKELGTLKAADYNLNKALDFGFFDIIAKPLLVAMNWIYGFTKSYGLTIIILTVFIKIILYPLTLKSFKSMKELQKIQPLMKELQAKYKEDKQRLNQEMMKLYSEHKINPMGGCLPMLLQIPILFALYKVFYQAIELRHTPFHIFGTWLPDLSAKDPYYITPILMGVSQFVLQKMSPAPGDEMQQKIMLIMPVMFTVLFLNFPSGLVIYWLISNILSIAQQAYINRKHT